MSRIAVPYTRLVRQVGPDHPLAVFVPRVALPDGSRVFVRPKDVPVDRARVALPLKSRK